MKLETALSAVDFLLRKNLGKNNPVDIIFTGGEPLLEWGNILKIIFYAKKLAFKMRIPLGTIGFPTNGLLLNEKVLDFCSKEEISLAVSIDGLDNKRSTTDAGNSFYAIKKKLPLLLKYRDIVRIRSTVHPDYVENSFKIFKEFLKMGFVKIDMQPVIGIKWDLAERNVYLNNLTLSLKEVEKIKKREIDFSVDIKHFRDFSSDCKGDEGCPKIKEEFLVDIDGNIYPCEFYLSLSARQRKKYSIGNLGDGVDLKLAEKNLTHKICDSGNVVPILKEKCALCKKTQGCYKICLGFDQQKKKFNSQVALNNWILFREIEKIYASFENLS